MDRHQSVTCSLYTKCQIRAFSGADLCFFSHQQLIRCKTMCGVPFDSRSFSGTHSTYPQRDGQVELTCKQISKQKNKATGING